MRYIVGYFYTLCMSAMIGILAANADLGGLGLPFVVLFCTCFICTTCIRIFDYDEVVKHEQ